MSRKIKNKKLKHPASHDQVIKKGSLIKFLIVAAAVGALVWGLIVLSIPSSNLEPYDKFKKNQPVEDQVGKTPDENFQAADEASREEEPPPQETPLSPEEEAVQDEIQQISDQINSPITPSPVSNLSREALEHLSKGMGLVEKGKFEVAELEFEKPRRSVRTPRRFSPYGPRLFACRKNSKARTGDLPGLLNFPLKTRKSFSTGDCPS